jgi:ADP-ribose pyrophosphatase YjhB (NUDIX family)
MMTMAERGPALVVAGCIVKGGDILLARRNQPELPDAHLRWELPGGKVLLEESLHDALRREIEEELGTSVEIVRLLPHVQSNVYHPGEDRVAHAIVLGFECVLSLRASPPHANDPAIMELEWIDMDEVGTMTLLPGTLRFVECLKRLDQASYGATHIYVRLEKGGPDGAPTDFWEIRTVYDLWSQFNILERHGNLRTRSTHNRLIPDIPESELMQRVTERLRALARFGYSITYSDDARLTLGLAGL